MKLQHLKEDRVLKISRVYNYNSLKPACMSGSGAELPARSHREGVELDMPQSFPLQRSDTAAGAAGTQKARRRARVPEEVAACEAGCQGEGCGKVEGAHRCAGQARCHHGCPGLLSFPPCCFVCCQVTWHSTCQAASLCAFPEMPALVFNDLSSCESPS